jgi:hypothetical protein
MRQPYTGKTRSCSNFYALILWHSFVYVCEAQELQEFSQCFDCLSLLLAAQPAGLGDELIAAFLRQAGQAHNDHHTFLVAAGKELAVSLNGQTSRLNAILRRIKE